MTRSSTVGWLSPPAAADRVRQHGLDVLAGGVPPADVGRYRLVPDRHLDRHDDQLPGDGRCRLPLGRRSATASGPRIVVLCGSVLLGLGLVLASRATSLVEFQLVFGLFIGAAAGAFYAPMMALASGGSRRTAASPSPLSPPAPAWLRSPWRRSRAG